MNPSLEMADETTTETPLVEVLTEEQVAALTDPQAFLKQIEAVEQLKATLSPTDELAIKRLAALGATATFSARFAEEQRVTIVGPLNEKVDAANLIWMPIVKRGKATAQEINAIVSKAIDDRRKAAAIEQQRLIDEAKAKQDELDRKAKEERDEADRLRQLADQAKTIDEADVLHQQADKLEKKAGKDELKASQVVTTVVPTQSKTLDLGGVTFSAKAPKKIWILAGWDKQKPLRLTDHKLSALVGDLSKLPEGVQFLLKYSDLNPVYLNKAFGEVPFPKPFGETDDYKGSSVRGK